MLRPATPLAVALFAAFGLLLMSVLSTPVIKGIPLGSFDGVTFGVFGFCKGDECSRVEIGYDASGASTEADRASFDLPSNTRNTLSTVLVIHPVACVLTLTMFIMSIAAHFHAPSHSVRYLLLVFILSIFDFLACLLSFLIDILLFAPHMAWGSWIVLAATILVALASLVSCAMRRTLVSRKSRKKRIAENAEMSGENFYNRQAQATAAAATRQPTMPVMSGANSNADKLPVFASFEKKEDRSSDERIPLTARSPSERSPNAPPSDMMGSADTTLVSALPPAGMRRSPSIPRDQYGNPIGGGAVDAYALGRGPSSERLNPHGRGGMAPGSQRGRGGYYPPRGGGYGQGRGGYGPPGRGGYGPPQGGRGGYGPPTRGFGGAQRGRGPPPGYQYERNGPYAARGPSPGPPSAPGYGPNASQPSVSTGSYDPYNPARESDLPRAESPPPLPEMAASAVAVEMDAASGSPQHPPKDFGQYGHIRESDSDIAGMVGLQQGMRPPANQNEAYPRDSDTSRYSQEEYVPPRAHWNNNGRNSPRMPSPLNVPGRTDPGSVPLNSRSPPPPEAPNSNAYFEDVDPRFAEQPSLKPPPVQTSTPYEDIPQGSRSPAESDRSNFTSISQRGVNPRWNPPPPSLMPGYTGQQMARRPPPRDQSAALLNNNPDFAIPGGRNVGNPPRGGPPGGGMTPPSAYPAL